MSEPTKGRIEFNDPNYRELRRDAGKLQGLNQRQAQRIAELEAKVAELRAAAEPFARYIETRTGIFGKNSRASYPELLISAGVVMVATADLRKDDWERLLAAMRKEGM